MLGLIWAQTTAGVIGRNGEIPWRLPEDVAHFKSVTMGYPIVMGRKTWDSLPERFRPLVGRRNIVVTRQEGWTAEGVEVANSLLGALEVAGPGEVWIIGGGELYSAAMPLADRLSVTEIDADIAGDAYAPTIGPAWAHDDAPWQTSDRDGIRYRILEYLPLR